MVIIVALFISWCFVFYHKSSIILVYVVFKWGVNMKKSLSFKKRLSLSFIIIGIIPLLALTIYNFIFIVTSTRENIEEFTKNNLDIAAKLIDNDINTFTNMVNFVSSNEEVQTIMNKNDSLLSNNERFYDTQRLYTITRTITATQPIDTIPVHIISENQMTRFSTTNYFVPLYTDDRGNFYDRMKQNEGMVVTQIHRRVDGASAQDAVMAIGKTITDKKNNAHLGYVIADFYDSYFDNIFKNTAFIENTNVYLLDSNGYIITDKNLKNQTGFLFPREYEEKLKRPKGKISLTLDGKNFEGYFTTSKSTHIKVLELIPKNYFFKEALKNSRIFISITALAILLVILCVTILSNKISNPITYLSNKMNEVESGNRDVHVDFKGDDEIGRLGHNFNNMIDEINRLINEDYKKQLLIHQSEFKALKAQVNPHFLYNALGSINWMAKLNDMDGVCKMTSALGKFFRYNANTTTDIVSVKEELAQVNNYLTIQSLRYRDKFTVTLDVDPNILNCKILKLLIQPLVENAVIHGIEPKLDKGHIIIKGFEVNNTILFKIMDDGVGLGNSTSKGEGIGIDNVNRRMSLYYGENYGLTYGMEDPYTVFTIKIPKEE